MELYMSRAILIAIFSILSIVSRNDGYRILLVVGMPSRSHSILGYGIARNLLQAGHEVVQVTAYPNNKPWANYTEISVQQLDEIFSKIKEDLEEFKIKNMVNKKNSVNRVLIHYMAQEFHRQMFELEDFEKFLSDSNQKFDAVILEWFFVDALSGLAALFECPLIWLAMTDAHWNVLKLVDEIPNPAYTVDILSEYSPPLTMWQRTMELLDIIYSKIVSSFFLLFQEKPMYYRVFGNLSKKRGVTLPDYNKVVYDGSLLLINSHPSYGSAFKLPQNAKYVGGFHIETTHKPLPQELQVIMENAKDGVIFFSMGSNFKSADMSDEMKKSLLKTFATLKQTVIWKFESDLDNVPSNVHLVKWAPQQSILAHPNLKVFITHGGMLSTTEAIHYGVPVIGIPVAGDQHINMKAVVSKGFGITVNLCHNLGVPLGDAIDQILNNPYYKNKAKEISIIYHDRPVPPGKEIVHWVEHVVRTNGAPHLHSPALMVPWYQKMYLDLLMLITCFMFIVLRFVKLIIKRLKSKKDNKKKNH